MSTQRPIITPLLAEQMHSTDLDRELDKCRTELMSIIQRYEYLMEQRIKCDNALREMRRTWPTH